MVKKRTRKQKIKAKHIFTVSWKPDEKNTKTKAKNSSSEANVKRQFNSSQYQLGSKRVRRLKPMLSDNSGNLVSIKKDITKSLILAVIILASELVLYLLLPR